MSLISFSLLWWLSIQQHHLQIYLYCGNDKFKYNRFGNESVIAMCQNSFLSRTFRLTDPRQWSLIGNIGNCFTNLMVTFCVPWVLEDKFSVKILTSDDEFYNFQELPKSYEMENKDYLIRYSFHLAHLKNNVDILCNLNWAAKSFSWVLSPIYFLVSLKKLGPYPYPFFQNWLL